MFWSAASSEFVIEEPLDEEPLDEEPLWRAEISESAVVEEEPLPSAESPLVSDDGSLLELPPPPW